MNKLTLLIPANKEAESLPFFLKELGDYEFDKIVVLQKEDEETIKSIGATTMKDMGKVMGALKSKHNDTLDFSKVSAIIRELLK